MYKQRNRQTNEGFGPRLLSAQRGALLRRLVLAGVAALLLSGCGGRRGEFRIKGTLTSLQQGTFYVYSPDGGTTRLDTIHVVGGDFDYTAYTSQPCTYIIVYPNFSELPVFGGSGEVATLEGSANNLRGVKVSGSKDNEEMTRFRLRNQNLREEQIEGPATSYIQKHPGSRVSVYLFGHYLLRHGDTRPSQLLALVKTMAKAQPDNVLLTRWNFQLTAAASALAGQLCPPFRMKTLGGKQLTQNDLRGRWSLISFWASWEDESLINQHQLRRWKQQYGSRLNMLSLSLDVDPYALKNEAVVDSITWNSVCDYRSWDSPAVSLFAVPRVPYLIFLDPQLRIKWRGTRAAQLAPILQKALK